VDEQRLGAELVSVPRDLSRWITEAGVGAAPPASREQLDDARELREAIRRVWTARGRVATRAHPISCS